MLTKIAKYFAFLLLFAQLVACTPMDIRTAVPDIETRYAAQNSRNDFDHDALAKQYDDLAREMEAKVQVQKEKYEHRPFSSYFSKNQWRIKSRLTYKIRKYKKAAQEYLGKAAYHQKIAAEQTDRISVVKPNQAGEQIN